MNNDTFKEAINLAWKDKKKGELTIDEKQAASQGLKLIKKSKICLLGTNGEDGFPNIKAMLNLKQRGLKYIWFSTNTSSKRVKQLKMDNRACVYYVDEKSFEGLMLVGTVDILQDLVSRKMLWTEGAEIYYPLGVKDPDYTVLRFTARWGNYYYKLKNITFNIR